MQNYDAFIHPPDHVMPYTSEAEVVGFYSMPLSDADEWMVATGIYDAIDGTLTIRGNTWMGMLTDTIEPDLDDLDEVTESTVDRWLAEYHETLPDMGHTVASCSREIEKVEAMLEGDMHLPAAEALMRRLERLRENQAELENR